MQKVPAASYDITYYFTVLCSTEAEATAGVGRPEDPLSGTFRSGLSATGKPATLYIMHAMSRPFTLKGPQQPFAACNLMLQLCTFSNISYVFFFHNHILL